MYGPRILIGFYHDPATAVKVLHNLQRHGFAQSFLVSNGPDGRLELSGAYFLPHLRPLVRQTKRLVLPGEVMVATRTAYGRIKNALSILGRGETHLSIMEDRWCGRGKQEAEKETIRAEILGPDRLFAYALQLAKEYERVRIGDRGHAILHELDRHAGVIDRIREGLSESVHLEHGLTPSAEWLLDNIFLIKSQILATRRNLPKRYYEELPVIADGSAAGLPRAYGIAHKLLTHTDFRLDRDIITGFLQAYQRTSPLTSGELWAIPLMLRICLIDNLSRLSRRVYMRQKEHLLAGFWADRLLAASHQDPNSLLITLAEMACSEKEPSPHFAVRLINQLHDEPSCLAHVQEWLKRKLETGLAEMFAREQEIQTADQVSIANAVNSLRLISHLEWPKVFEEVSPIEAVLRTDPAGVYPMMDFASRDRYRHIVEEIARPGGLAEQTVAQAAIELAASSSAESDDPAAGHVGWYLVGPGRRILEQNLPYWPSLPRRLRNWMRQRANAVYLGGIAAVTAIQIGVLLHLVTRYGMTVSAVIATALSLFSASELAIQMVNYLITKVIPPTNLPKMSFVKGIPDEYRTLVVVPMMLLTPEAIRSELDRLETRYLGNPDPNLLYALFSDFTDAQTAETPEDEELLQTAVEGIRRLNDCRGTNRFFLFHRRRTWSESEQRWIGWERKRGKIEELNRFLLYGADGSGYNPLLAGDAAALRDIKYVITLDSDTQLPRDTARRLVETAAHPLNQVRLSPDGRVVRGYGIIQPRVSTSLPSAMATSFSRLFSDPAGIDPYAHAVSDVYQDLFLAGTFYGKGLYDLRVFDAVMRGRFPEAGILSHDLLEGAHVSVGFASDVELFDLFPASYQAFAKRQHRWIRGDWQIIDWLCSRVPTGGKNKKKREPNQLSLIDRWKIFDNLRRSLVPPATAGLLIVGWLWTPTPVLWTAFAATALFFPFLLQLLGSTRRLNSHRLIGTSLLRTLVSISFLPHQAVLSLDAIVRVWYRRLVSHRRLLEWETAQSAHLQWMNRRLGGQFTMQMSLACLATLAITAGAWQSPVFAAFPFLLLWLFAPAAAQWLNSKPKRTKTNVLTPRRRIFLREIARRTWRYFDEFVNDANNWLPPDNYQEDSGVGEARRTSPTNIGMWLLSALSALDLGYITPADMTKRTMKTMRTLDRLELYRGHPLNWYDTETLAPLKPKYVSTVDNGNLQASLWAFAEGCCALSAQPLIAPHILDGLYDTVSALRRGLGGETAKKIAGDLSAIEDLLADPPDDVWLLADRIERAAEPAGRIAATVAAHEPAGGETAYWADALARAVTEWHDFISGFLPWLVRSTASSLEAAAAGAEPAAGRPRAKAPTLQQLAAGIPLVYEGSTGIRIPNRLIGRAADAAKTLLVRAEELAAMAGEIAAAMDMRLLYNPGRRLFSIGLSVGEHRLDPSHYDFLASEARLASYVAIARGDVPNEHWFALSRPYGDVDGRLTLLSWNGTMFEYLMPLLLTRLYHGSMLEQACRAAVSLQINYARHHHIPWGISEAAFAEQDANHVYQYRAFGVPGLGLKRDLDKDLVVAPYATALALLVEPAAAAANLQHLAALDLLGRYGFYESIDYMRSAQIKGAPGEVVRAYMAHHQGMSLVALANTLLHGRIQDLFHADLRVRAVEPLLCERIPNEPPVVGAPGEILPGPRVAAASPQTVMRQFLTPDTPTPATHLLSNGTLTVMTTNAGGGFIRWRDLDLTRWRADTTSDAWGPFLYIRDLNEDSLWSAAYHPVGHAGRHYTVNFAADRVEIKRRDMAIETITEIAVPPDDDVELRRLTLTNRSTQVRTLEITSYMELALNTHGADLAHPAFSKMFVVTERLDRPSALLAHRRPQESGRDAAWMGHAVVGNIDTDAAVEFETDRRLFLGRGGSPRNPSALKAPLSNTAGFVLDPIFSLRCRVTLEPGQKTRIAFVTLAAPSREDATSILRKYSELPPVNAAMDRAAARAHLEARNQSLASEDIAVFQELAGHILYPNSRLRPPGARIRLNNLGQSRLWAYGISGDLPIVVVTVGDVKDLGLVKEILKAHTYLRTKGLQFDLVLLDEEAASYTQSLRDELRKIIQAQSVLTGMDKPGGVFLRAINQMSDEDLTLILATARVTLSAARGTLSQQLAAQDEVRETLPKLKPGKRAEDRPMPPLPTLDLLYFNGYGGFTADGKEYAIAIEAGELPPAPWSNVMANHRFGSLVTETGAGAVWYGNSQTNRLTPWSNDPVLDPPADALYLRDEDTGVFWTPTPLPIPEEDPYRTRHGQGYTIHEHNSHGIAQELTTFVPVDDWGGAPVRLQRLRLRNLSARRRRLSVTAYAEWVLGRDREDTQMHIVTKWDPGCDALVARNAYNPDYGRRVAFAALSPPADSQTADRTEFIGRNGSLNRPAAMESEELSGRVGEGLDPCAALRTTIEIESGGSAEVVFMLGQCADIEQVRLLIERCQDPAHVEQSLKQTRAWWERRLETVQVTTPDPAVNILLNRWLLYQTLSCRLWGRTAFYQSSGAFGFRDQLQDIMALVHTAPEIAREHIILAAGRQFVEGDVQHWWHPPTGGGTRTRCADDLLWLPYAVAYYVKVTGDEGILRIRVPYLDGRPLAEEEHEVYQVPASSSLDNGSVFEHCLRALEKGVKTGAHGLPLIGSCDWNDGLNNVGRNGRGESVWLAWFLVDLLKNFAALCDAQAEESMAASCRRLAQEITKSAESQAWDGDWYRRAYFDDGTPLGSAANEEGRIDSLPQSWAAISGEADPDRVERALAAVDQYLIKENKRLALLFTPPFDRSAVEPGYIKGYPPGVRENGGQYTHAAVWLALAHARRGDGDRAVAILRLLNPIEHALTPEDVRTYRVEPYVVAADVYSLAGREGHGGWTWYTGAAGWMYRVWLEEVLGFRREGSGLRLDPVIPSSWTGFNIEYRFGNSQYRITVENPKKVNRGVLTVTLDGAEMPGTTIPLVDDGGRHTVRVKMGVNARQAEDAGWMK